LVANEMRRRRVGEVVTYVVNRNINFTNVCIGNCRFCAFRRGINDKEAYFLNIEDITKRAKVAEAAGASEVCIQGGLHPDIDSSFYSDMLVAIKKATELHIHAFSPMEICYIAEKSGLGIKETLKTLKEAGLDSIPGTAAEILDDAVRERICPHKIKTDEWKEIITTAHKLGIPTTATMMYGHVETSEDQIRHLKILRDIQDETGGFTEFVPLSFVHFNAPLYKEGKSKSGATGYEDLRVYVISRIFLDNFDNLQASWVKLGRKLSQLMLNFGANDLGGTLMEENISRSAGMNVEMMEQSELERMIVDVNRVPKERDTLYNLKD
ncbi:MAG: 5-amino-6-(D-ribitylamino)uracil--L-tyrosine 4-hydroxyphenyl transferase CofH, partial [Candidatus Hydrothermarchaeales archaeon]